MPKAPQLNATFVHLLSTVQQGEQEKVSAEVPAQSEEARRQGSLEAGKRGSLDAGRIL
jgi:hypothetical protein